MAQAALSVILASASPRRRHLLEQAGIGFRAVCADVEEALLPGETPEAHVRRLACCKAETVAVDHPRQLVLGADTVVVVDGRVLGKPADMEAARGMLRRLSGRSHCVLTGVCLTRVSPALSRTWVARSDVRFKPLDSAVIEAYVAAVNPLDKAGAYGIQDHGDMLVERVDGLVSTVIGLPIEEVGAVVAEIAAAGA